MNIALRWILSDRRRGGYLRHNRQAIRKKKKTIKSSFVKHNVVLSMIYGWWDQVSLFITRYWQTNISFLQVGFSNVTKILMARLGLQGVCEYRHTTLENPKISPKTSFEISYLYGTHPPPDRLKGKIPVQTAFGWF